MRRYRASLVLDAKAALGECPLWSPDEACLYWVDIAGKAIHRFNPANGTDRAWPAPSEPGCIAFAKNGGLVAALRDGFHRFMPDTGAFARIASVDHDIAQFRFNDGRCDRRGRFWAGTMFEPRTDERASMFCLEDDRVRERWGPRERLGVKVSNGLAFSPDDRWLYQADTPNHVIHRFPFDLASGEVGPRGIFARVPANRGEPGYGGRPDGAAVDREGNYWSAQFEGGRVLCFSPRGDPIATVSLPVRRPTMVAFGGADMRTLFIATAREGAGDEELAATPTAGGLFSCEVETMGIAEPCYADRPS